MSANTDMEMNPDNDKKDGDGSPSPYLVDNEAGPEQIGFKVNDKEYATQPTG